MGNLLPVRKGVAANSSPLMGEGSNKGLRSAEFDLEGRR
jgi:hypothetical protein